MAGLEYGTSDSPHPPTPPIVSHPTRRPATSNIPTNGVTSEKVSQPPPTLAIRGEACGVGNGVGTDNPATGTPAQRPRIAGGGGGSAEWALSDCLGEVVSLCRTHEVLISVCMKRRGQISGEEDRSQREAAGRGVEEVEGPAHWFPLATHTRGGCAGLSRNVGSKGPVFASASTQSTPNPRPVLSHGVAGA